MVEKVTPFVVAVAVAAPLGHFKAPLWACALAGAGGLVFSLWWRFIRLAGEGEPRE